MKKKISHKDKSGAYPHCSTLSRQLSQHTT